MNDLERIAKQVQANRKAADLPPMEGGLSVGQKYDFIDKLESCRVWAGEASRAAQRAGDESQAQLWSQVWDHLQEALNLVRTADSNG